MSCVRVCIHRVESAYHPCGTCKMGAGKAAMDVVDSDLRVAQKIRKSQLYSNIAQQSQCPLEH